MKSRNRNITILLMTVLAVIFTSCTKDPFDEKRNASLNIYPSDQITSNSGIFSVQKEISKKDISNVDHNDDWEKVVNIWLKSSQFRIESNELKPDDLIKLDMSCSKVNTRYSETITVQSFNNTKSGIDINMSQDAGYASFMEKVFNELKSAKSLDFKIQGIVTDKSEFPVADVRLVITLNNKLEIKVRQYGVD